MPENPLLHRSIRSNAVFSFASALLMLAFADWIAAELGLGNVTFVYATATVLLLFSLQLANIVRTKAVRRFEISGVIAADIGWVIGSLIFVVALYPTITLSGLVLIDIVALVVLYLAIQQFRGLRKLPNNAC